MAATRHLFFHTGGHRYGRRAVVQTFFNFVEFAGHVSANTRCDCRCICLLSKGKVLSLTRELEIPHKQIVILLGISMALSGHQLG